MQESEGLMVPMKLVKASGGTGPWFRNALEEAEGSGIGDESRNP